MLHPDTSPPKDERAEEATNGKDENSESRGPRRSTMTRQKAGQRGGLTTARRHGKEFYEKIGRKGGQSRKKADKEGVPA